MFRFIHTADLHLDSPLKALRRRNADLAETIGVATRTAFERIIDKAIEEKVDALLIAGDLYDGSTREMSTGLYLADSIRRLSEAGVHTLVIYGNHDAESVVKPPFPDTDLLTVFKSKPDTVRFDEHQVAVHGASFKDAKVPDDMSPDYPDPISGWVNIAMLHTSLGGYAAHGDYAPTTAAKLTDKGYDYWALGHVHKIDVVQKADQGKPWIIYPGIPQGRDMGETGPGQAVLGTVDNGKITIEWFDTSPVVLERVAIDMMAAETLDDVRSDVGRMAQEAVSASASAARRDAHTIVRLEITAPARLSSGLRRFQDELLDLVQTNIAARSDRVAIEKISVVRSAMDSRGGDIPATDVESSLNDETLADLLQLVASEAAGDVDLVSAVSKDFEGLLAKLPADIRNDPGLLNAITDLNPETSGDVSDWFATVAGEAASTLLEDVAENGHGEIR
ncbi:metallophosphoesterase family protein [Thalassobaculum litoreum]|uniref:DNA repair exonuclease SbcCD nuclease subunit n=1 Tax=Thalassobaculum litoreum DSM 18839 TaxID=1123362 RepID=A0A8G2EW98_9PROT|nr:DNA repair exonuclease [Thalassobaculum litoreum]SDG17880.1 DNA repair exonuclease SbcCD nuclease subunit [Thalassobaculum litoreum DSM 18839]